MKNDSFRSTRIVFSDLCLRTKKYLHTVIDPNVFEDKLVFMLKINQIKLIFLIFFFSPLTKSETLILRADSWCPFSCNPKFSQVGYMVDIAREIFKKKNIQIDYQLMNWDIAKLELREGKIQGIVGASKGDGDLIFPIHALGKYQNFLYFLPTLSTKIQKKLENLSTLKDLKIGVVKDYSYGVQADQLIKDRPELFIKVSGAEPLEVLLKMLDEGKMVKLMLGGKEGEKWKGRNTVCSKWFGKMIKERKKVLEEKSVGSSV